MIVPHNGPGTPGDGPDPLEHLPAARGHDVFGYDRFGSGRSGRPADPTGCTVARQVAGLEAVSERIGAGRVVLLGASWGPTRPRVPRRPPGPGGAHGPRLAGRPVGPGPAGAATRATSGTGSPREQRRIDALEASPRPAAWSLLVAADPRAAHALVPDAEIDLLFARPLAIAAPAATCHPERLLRDLPASLPGFWANQLTTADQLTVPDPRAALRRVRVPVPVVRGACDHENPATAREYTEVMPGATLLTVAGAGHLVDAEQPGAYRREVVRFLES